MLGRVVGHLGEWLRRQGYCANYFILVGKIPAFLKNLLNAARQYLGSLIARLPKRFLTGKYASSNTSVTPSFSASSYEEFQNRSIDLDALKAAQQYRPSSRAELDRITDDIDIQESIEKLLADLKRMG